MIALSIHPVYATELAFALKYVALKSISGQTLMAAMVAHLRQTAKPFWFKCVVRHHKYTYQCIILFLI